MNLADRTTDDLRSAATPQARLRVAGISVDAVSHEDVLSAVRRAVRLGESLRIHTLNVDHVVVAHQRPSFKSVIESADLVVPDGMPIVWAMRAQGGKVARITGVDLSESLFFAEEGFRIFLLGGEDGVAAKVAERMAGLGVPAALVGIGCPTREELLSDSGCRDIVTVVNASGADVLLVALGAPVQEEWLTRYGGQLVVPVRIGVGATFDFLSGRLKRAPKFVQRVGMEWLFRIFQDPGRLLKRYLGRDWRFFWLMIKYSRLYSMRGNSVGGRSHQ